MNNIQAVKNQSRIKKEDLSKYHYTISLLQEAKEKNLIDQNTIAVIQQDILLILKELIQKYTEGKSSSVKVETAESIQASILYTIDCSLTICSSPAESLEIIQQKKMNEIYKHGIKIIEKNIVDSEKLYNEIKNHRLNIPLEVYNLTIDQALPDFFTKYDLKYRADNTMTMIDYPLVFDDMKVQGVSYIKNYLDTFLLETTFCNFFDINDIKNLLVKYGYLYDIEYKESLINVFELVLNNSIFSSLLNNNVSSLEISISKYNMLVELFKETPPEEISILIKNSIKKIIQNLDIQNKKLTLYMKNYIPVFMSRLLNTIENNCLYNLTLTDINNQRKDKIIFSSQDSMSNNIFRNLVDMINNCTKTEDKINIIKSKVKSIDDFLDILSADCLYDNDFFELYRSISDMELAILAKLVFFEEIRSGQFNILMLETNEDIEEWKVHYINFLNQLSKSKKANLMKLINKIEF